MTATTSRPDLTSSDLRVDGLTKLYGKKEVGCIDVDFTIADGEFFTIVGPSGSGKTTLMRMIAGMLKPTAGRVLLGDTDITALAPQVRPTAMVFQHLALFPHRTVGQNIAFPLKVRGVGKGRRRATALEMLDLLRLPADFIDKPVTTCSGGERQRVAIARALAYEPQILLFDEPLSAIDYQLRKVLQRELKQIHQRTGRTFIYVTHSLEEALVMSDRIAIMNDGSVAQVGTPEDIYHRPARRMIAEFMGAANVWETTLTPDGSLRCADIGRDISFTGSKSEHGFFMLRPEQLTIVDATGPAFANTLTGTISTKYIMGSRIHYLIDVGDTIVTAEELVAAHNASEGDTITVGWSESSGWSLPR